MTVAQWVRDLEKFSVRDNCPVGLQPAAENDLTTVTVAHLKRLVTALEYLRDHPDISPDAVRARVKEGLGE